MPERESPWGLSAANEFIATVLMSGKVVGIKPLSGVLISGVDMGKSESLKQYRDNEGVQGLSDATSYGIVSNLLSDIQKGKISHIIIPDLLKIRRRNPNVSKELISLLNSLAEEGLLGQLTYNVQVLVNDPLHCGFLTSITMDEYEKAKKRWREIGFSSRIIPFFFGYSEEDLKRAEDDVLYEREVFQKVSLPQTEPKDVKIEDSDRRKIGKIAEFAGRVNEDYTAFRTTKQMIGLAKAHALLEGRIEVSESDIQFLRCLVPFWFDPIFGNDCHYYILRELPKKSEELVKALADKYSRATVHRHKDKLAEREVIKRDDDNQWTATY